MPPKLLVDCYRGGHRESCDRRFPRSEGAFRVSMCPRPRCPCPQHQQDRGLCGLLPLWIQHPNALVCSRSPSVLRRPGTSPHSKWNSASSNVHPLPRRLCGDLATLGVVLPLLQSSSSIREESCLQPLDGGGRQISILPHRYPFQYPELGKEVVLCL